jgi:hypothetical protein
MIDPDTKNAKPGYKEFNHSHPLRSYIIKLALKDKDIMFRVKVK